MQEASQASESSAVGNLARASRCVSPDADNISEACDIISDHHGNRVSTPASVAEPRSFLDFQDQLPRSRDGGLRSGANSLVSNFINSRPSSGVLGEVVAMDWSVAI